MCVCGCGREKNRKGKRERESESTKPNEKNIFIVLADAETFAEQTTNPSNL